MREESTRRSSNWWLYLVMTAVMLIAVGMSTGCSSYTRFTLSEEKIRFSFEYPRNYEEIVAYLYEGDETPTYVFGGLASVSFERSVVEDNWTIERSYLRVWVYEAGLLDNPDAQAALENEIASFATNEDYRDFEILDRSPVTIAGVEGEQITFSYCIVEQDPILGSSPGTIAGAQGEQVTFCYCSYCDFETEPTLGGGEPTFKLPITLTVRCAYFDYNGFIWEIYLQSTEAFLDEDQAHFEHIVETFTILD